MVLSCYAVVIIFFFFFSSRRRHTRLTCDWSSDVCSSDLGFAKRLDASLAIIDKRRPSANIAEVLNVVGEVEDRDCLIPDDMIDTAGTISEAAAARSEE